jgi:glycosyltransferase involved in cell wall biosynthesis
MAEETQPARCHPPTHAHDLDAGPAREGSTTVTGPLRWRRTVARTVTGEAPVPTTEPHSAAATTGPQPAPVTDARHVHLGTSLGRPTPAPTDPYQLRRERRRRADALAGALARAGARTTVVTDRQGVVAPDPTVRIARVGNARRGGLPLPGLVPHLLPLGRSSVLHLHVDGIGDLVGLNAAAAAHRGRVVLHVHSSTGGAVHSGERARSRRLLDAPLGVRLVRRADLVVVGSDRSAERAEAAGAREVVVIPPAVLPPPPALAAADPAPRRERRGRGRRRRLVAVGPLTSQRRPSVLVDLLAELPEGVELLLVGNGPERAAIQRTARSRGVADRVSVRPNITWATLTDALAGADVVTSAALVGEDPGVTLLAMAAGRPVVGTAAEGLPRVLTDGVDGWLVPPLRVNALGAALAEALDRPAEAAARAASGRRRVAARGWDEVASEVLTALG